MDGSKASLVMFMRFVVIAAIAVVLVNCSGPAQDDLITAVVVADGDERTLTFSSSITVEELLSSANIKLGVQDRVSHPLTLPIVDEMRVTVRRVREIQVCQRESLPYETVVVAYEAIPPGEEQLARAGKDGVQESCYRSIQEDNVETDRVPLRQPIILEEPQDEIINVGPSDVVPNLSIPGRLSYINNRAAWTIQGNTTDKRLLRATDGLDSLVFAQNSQGTHLIYTREVNANAEFLNELWLLDYSFDSRPIKLAPSDVLFADWRPGTANMVGYSTGEAGQGGGAWRSLNNLWLMQIDRLSGAARSIEEIIPERSGGSFGWWGTLYRWSPKGDQMAWASAEATGVVDFERKLLIPLLEYAAFDTSQAWVWLSSLSWSPDSRFIVSVRHGRPLGSEPAVTSPVFDLAVTRADGAFAAVVRDSVGMWSGPAYSPGVPSPSASSEEGYLSWLQARTPHNSNNSEYDLMIADRDGSNQRQLFPAAGEPGIRKSNSGFSAQAITWSPDASTIALIYQGNLWLVEIESGAGDQITFDGGASRPVWTG